MIGETDLLARFERVKRQREGDFLVTCPAHDDGNPSLHVTLKDRWVLHCFAGCPTAHVLDVLGLEFRDLFPDGDSKPWSNAGMRRTGATFDRDGRVRLGGTRYMPNAAPGVTKTLAAKGSKRDLWPDPSTVTGETLFVVEGEADAVTGASLGVPTVSVPGAGKWGQDWAARLAEGRQRVVVIADSDEPGRAAAGRVAAAIAEHCADVKLLDLAPDRTDGHDLSDFLADVRDDDEHAQARALLIAAAENAASVNGKPAMAVKAPSSNGNGPSKPMVERSRSTADLLSSVTAQIRRFIAFRDDEQALTVALWVMHTHAIDAAAQTPYLSILSAEKRSGKTRLLEVLHGLCARAEHASGASEAGLFQLVDNVKPTLLVDEIDAVFGSSTERTEALRGVINSGNRRGATVIRGDKSGEPKRYETFCPKVLAGIENGRLPDTIRDRSIPIVLRRKRPDATIERFLWRDVGHAIRGLHDDIAAWAVGMVDSLSAARPDLPSQLDDRAAEGWEPLLAIADLAGWGDQARAAALALSAQGEDDESRGVGLLRDIGSVFDAEAMSSADLAAALNALAESQWGAWHDGSGLNQRDLARLLKPYEIRSRNVRVGDAVPKGFQREQFSDAWERYVPDKALQALHPNNGGGFVAGDAADVADVADVAANSPHARADDPRPADPDVELAERIANRNADIGGSS